MTYSQSLKVVSYNVWHGLNGQGVLRFGELEPSHRRRQRYAQQIEELELARPDVVFLQEVNPLPARAQHFAQNLKMDVIWQRDNCGIKLGNKGFPDNLNSGLAILARPALGIKKIESIKLSGPFGFCSDSLAIQFSEFRYALLAEVSLNGQKILLINIHLHHGPQPEPELLSRIQQLKLSGAQKQAILAAIEAAQIRRIHEVETVLRRWAILKRTYEKAVWAGDFNCTSESVPIQKVESAGFTSVCETILPTWDTFKNQGNHDYLTGFAPPVPTYGRSDIVRAFHEAMASPKQIDHVFVYQIRYENSRLFADQPKNGLIASDHFGVETALRPV